MWLTSGVEYIVGKEIRRRRGGRSRRGANRRSGDYEIRGHLINPARD
jgi:hypothetical protein